jgi:hypothetical protein
VELFSYPHICLYGVDRDNFTVYILVALAKLRKATISFIMRVIPFIRLSVCLPASGPTGRILNTFYIRVVFRKSVEKFQDSLKSDKNNGYFT